MKQVFSTLFCGLFLVACNPQAPEDWQLIHANSHINFTTVKNETVTEHHTFDRFSGRVTGAGTVEILIDYASVDTNVDIRDSRLNEHFFPAANTPQARITATVDMSAFDNMAIDETRVKTVNFTLTGLAATPVQLMAELRITRHAETQVTLLTQSPIILNVEDLGLGEALETLRNLAGLEAISPDVPVTIALIFERT